MASTICEMDGFPKVGILRCPDGSKVECVIAVDTLGGVHSISKSVTASYEGALLPGWGDGCPSYGELPWSSGAFRHADTISCEQGGRTKSLGVRRGDVLCMESN